ncbi:MAG: hypothetical protein AVDCRST_MAG19-1691 [uncultured Thermomicrobiales bacterium]|uniref:Uncharacterized protein n=1 Tax=uncultured Thermomicrobiales bacterium TaxID=1645740 RepID=A0A6J4UTN8_9BACT|nr:MAG: hypothetical protein AVDCRST_MAG19-1691 [uncultured Thermomicrobiales bacterium]
MLPSGTVPFTIVACADFCPVATLVTEPWYGSRVISLGLLAVIAG